MNREDVRLECRACGHTITLDRTAQTKILAKLRLPSPRKISYFLSTDEGSHDLRAGTKDFIRGCLKFQAGMIFVAAYEAEIIVDQPKPDGLTISQVSK